jgi:HEAT repeat protein
LGEKDKRLGLALRQFRVDPQRLTGWEHLEKAATRFAAAGQSARFTAWVKQQRDRHSSLLVRAYLSWWLREHSAAIGHLAEAARRDPTVVIDVRTWRTRFACNGAAREREFLQTYLAARPNDLALHRELLLESQMGPQDPVAPYEVHLNRPRQGNSRPDVYTLYDLLRLCEKHGRCDRLVAWAMRLVRQQPPFEGGRLADYLREDLHWYEYENTLLCCLLKALPYLDARQLRELRDLAQQCPSPALKNQVARRLAGPGAPRVDPVTDRRPRYRKVRVTTVGLPSHITLLTWRDDVCSFLPDGSWVGTRWGVVRYQPGKDSLDILQVPVGDGVTSLCQTPHGLFLGSPKGLFLLRQPESARPELVQVPLEGTSSQPKRLHWAQDWLWIEESEPRPNSRPPRVSRYNPVRQEVQDLGNTVRGIFPFAGRMWAENAVFDPRREEFVPVQGPSQRWRFIGASARELWAMVQHEAFGWRPALVDPLTRRFRVLPIDNVPHGEMVTAKALKVLSENQEQVWLGDGEIVLCYSRRSGSLCRRVPPGEGDDPRRLTDPVLRLGHVWHFLALPEHVRRPNGRYFVGVRGGMFEIDVERLTSIRWGSPEGELPGDIRRLVLDREENRLYICTSGGLAILSLPDHRLVARITAADGLPSDHVEDVARIGDRLYFACAGGRAGLAVLDRRTGLIRPFLPRDGLGTSSVVRIEVENGRLHVYPGASFHPSFRPRVPSTLYDPATDSFREGGRVLDETRWDPSRWNVVHQGKRYRTTLFGLLIHDEKRPFVLDLPRLRVKLRQTNDARWREEAKKQAALTRPAELARGLCNANPRVRQKFLQEVSTLPAARQVECIPLLERAVRDQDRDVRAAAVAVLAAAPNCATRPLLRSLLADPDREVRDAALLGLVRQGEKPPSERIEALCRRVGQPHQEDKLEDAIEGLAPMADSRVFALILKSRMWADDGLWKREAIRGGGSWPDRTDSGRQEVFRALSARLRARPELADVFLRSSDLVCKPNVQALTEAIFILAGPSLLPRVYEGLSSRNRIVRANAARLAAALAGRESIGRLRKALDLESGLSRAAIVQALARLKAREALPDLAKLYTELLHDPGAGFRAGQLAGLYDSHYRRIGTLDGLAGAWRDLKSVLDSDLEQEEELDEDLLLSEKLILEAVAEIGPQAVEDFNRALAARQVRKARNAAAIPLKSDR